MGGKRGSWPASWSSPPSKLQPLVEATHTDWTLLHSTTGCLARQLMSSRSIVLSKQSLKVKKYFQHSWNEYQKNWPLLKNYFFRPKKTSENKTWMVSYPMKFLRPLLRLLVGRKFAVLPLSKNSWRSHNKEANEKTFDFMRPKLYFIWILEKKLKSLQKAKEGWVREAPF